MRKTAIILFLILFVISLNAIEFNLAHYLSLSGRVYEEDIIQSYLARTRYQPDLSLTFWQKDFCKLDMQQIADFALQFNEQKSENNKDFNLDISAGMYRSWLRYSAEQYEIRLGLQQINFGTATIHRPLKWFDNIDPRDSRKKTDGVYALLGKKYFLNNANLWFWLLKPDDLKSENLFEYISENVEIGGRIQYPFQYCEAGFSVHHSNSEVFESETKIGLDLRWDMAIGFWVESSLNIYNDRNDKFYSRLFMLGGDYTLGIGNGIYCLMEHLYFSNMETELLEPADRSAATSLLLSYPLGLFDSVKSIISYNWLSEVESYYLSYNKSYNYLSIYLNLYLNPYSDEVSTIEGFDEGKSIELMLETKF